jgi:hypothetical protein
MSNNHRLARILLFGDFSFLDGHYSITPSEHQNGLMRRGATRQNLLPMLGLSESRSSRLGLEKLPLSSFPIDEGLIALK